MNILDENIPENQRFLLKKWNIRIHQIGVELSHKGIQDENIVPLLRQLKNPTFFTRDSDFYNNRLCHQHYCIVFLNVTSNEIASFIWRFTKHPIFNTQAKRMGKIIRITHAGISYWTLKPTKEEHLGWTSI